MEAQTKEDEVFAGLLGERKRKKKGMKWGLKESGDHNSVFSSAKGWLTFHG